MRLALLQDVLRSAPKTDFCKYHRHDACFDGYHVFFIITLVLKAAKQPLTTARSAGEIKA